MMLCRISMFLFAVAAGAGYYFIAVNNRPAAGLFMPVLAIILLIFAFRAIDKDEKLVRSADRLR